MKILAEINNYILSQPDVKRNDLQTLHNLVLVLNPKCKLWFLDGKNNEGKVVANPNIGYGSYIIKYTDGKTREFYQIGLSANTTGISIYIMGIEDKKFLINNFGDKLGKASITGYCIKFKSLKDINVEVLKEAITFGFKNS